MSEREQKAFTDLVAVCRRLRGPDGCPWDKEQTLQTILEHVLAQPSVGEVIAVDDGSKDRSWDLLASVAARDPRVRPLRQERNAGKGAALRSCAGAAPALGGVAVVPR